MSAAQHSTALVIAGISIIQDEHGRYNLNTLHQASGAGEAKKPGNWIKRASTKALQTELESQMSFLTLDVVVGGDRSGTYAHEILAVEYAGWISPAFRIKVNQAFIDLRMGRLQPIAVPMTPIQALLQTVQQLAAVESRVSQLETSVAALEAHKPPENKLTVPGYLKRFHKPYLHRDILDAFKAACTRREHPEGFRPQWSEHPLNYYTLATLDAAYAEATRQLSFLAQHRHR